MRHKFIIYFIVLFKLLTLSHSLSCKDENNRNVDWFIVYKLPKITDEPSGSPLAKGTAYSYLNTRTEKWKLSTHEITSEQSILGRTWQELKEKENSATYLFYNDDTPEVFRGSAVGHLKGILAFDDNSGYWLIHSIPRFGRLNIYEYPVNAVTNGQYAMCVTFKVSELKEICKQLLFSHPNIYLKKITSTVSTKLDDETRSLFAEKPAFVRSAPFDRKTTLKSNARREFVSFAKDNQLANDLYSDIIAPELKTSLFAETWRRGVGTNLPSFCQTNFDVTDIIAINITVTIGRKNKSIYFKSTEDHSKWAISTKSSDNWVCMADMNRMASQEKRGGGALCFQSEKVWREFRNIISEAGNCNK